MPTMPQIIVLLALKKEIADIFAIARVAGKKVTVRHERHRDAEQAVWPSVSIAYVSHDPSQEYGRQENDGGLPEEVWALSVNVVIDADLPPEATDEGDADLDPTGYGTHAAIMSLIIDRLFPDGDENTIGGTTWQIRYDGSADNESDATPDNARVEERLTLLYRVRADRPNILLMGN